MLSGSPIFSTSIDSSACSCSGLLSSSVAIDVSAIFLKNAWLSKLYFFSSSMNYLTTRTRTHLRVLLLQHVLEVEQNQQLVVHALHLRSGRSGSRNSVNSSRSD